MKLLFGLLLLAPLFVSAQIREWDFNTWTSISLTKKIEKKWDLTLNAQARFYQNSSRLDETFIDLGSSYALAKHVKLSGNYRFGMSNVNPTTTGFNRFYFDLEWEKPNKFLFKTKRLSISTRSRFQGEYSTKLLESQLPKYYIRQKFIVKYTIRGIPIDPYIGAEVFLRVRDATYAFGTDPRPVSYFDKTRLIVGADWNLSKKHKIGVHYTYQHLLNNNERAAILGVEYRYKLRKWKRPKK